MRRNTANDHEERWTSGSVHLTPSPAMLLAKKTQSNNRTYRILILLIYDMEVIVYHHPGVLVKNEIIKVMHLA